MKQLLVRTTILAISSCLLLVTVSVEAGEMAWPESWEKYETIICTKESLRWDKDDPARICRHNGIESTPERRQLKADCYQRMQEAMKVMDAALSVQVPQEYKQHVKAVNVYFTPEAMAMIQATMRECVK